MTDEVAIPSAEELVRLAIGQKPIEFQAAFTDLVVHRAAAAIDDRKMEVAHSLFNSSQEQEEPEVEPEEEEVDDQNS